MQERDWEINLLKVRKQCFLPFAATYFYDIITVLLNIFPVVLRVWSIGHTGSEVHKAKTVFAFFFSCVEFCTDGAKAVMCVTTGTLA